MADPISEMINFLINTALPRFGQGIILTLVIAGFGIIIGFGLGILAGTGRSFGGPIISRIFGLYVEIVRGVPLIVQMLIWRYAIPGVILIATGHDIFSDLGSILGIEISPAVMSAIIAIGINSGAYQAEIVRAGINAIPVGQTEAGLSIGLSKGQVINTILLPQTLRMAIPPLINEFVIVIKDTSLALAIGVLELAGIAQSLTSQFPGRIFDIYITNAVIYLVICFSLSFTASRIEKRLAIAGYGVKSRRSLL